VRALSRGKLLGRRGGDQRVSVRGVPSGEPLGRRGGDVRHVSRGELCGGGRGRGVRGVQLCRILLPLRKRVAGGGLYSKGPNLQPSLIHLFLT